MHFIRGYYRLCLCALTMGFIASLALFTSWMPFKVKGYRPVFWVTVLAARALLFFLNVRVECAEPEKLRQHHGFLFPNHVSYLDVLALVKFTPTRFLAKAEIRTWPIVGYCAQSIGCVFVERGNKQSRQEAREAVARAERFPPITIFPEGKRGPGDELLPFRYGAFEIMTEGNAAYLPCAIVYHPLEIAIWPRGEPVLKAIWRLASYGGGVQTQIIPLPAVQATPADDPIQLAKEAHAQLTAVLNIHQHQSSSTQAETHP